MSTVTLINMDVREGLRTLPDSSIHCIVTSPPYWGLRTYAGAIPVKWSDGSSCVLGMEPSIEEYVVHLVEVFRELKRVLHPTGTFWLNLGDCYNHAGPQPSTGVHKQNGVPLPENYKRVKTGRSLKNLSLIPARTALALQADGWLLRQDNIWVKGCSFLPSFSGSVMPESIQDRTVWAHEHLYQFALERWEGKEVAPLSKEDAIWLAAMIDGEGCITINRQPAGSGSNTHDGFCPWLILTSTSQLLIEKMSRLCGKEPFQRGGSVRPAYHVRISANEAAALLRAVKPHLVEKGLQADLVLALQASRIHRGGKSFSGFTQENNDYQRKLWETIKALHRGESPDTSWVKWEKPGKWVDPDYFYDINGCREPYADSTRLQAESPYKGQAVKDYVSAGAQNPSDVKRRVLESVAAGGGRNLRNVWVIGKEPLKEAHFACVDSTTECLTQHGWKSYKNLLSSDRLAQLDTKSQYLYWGGLKRIHTYEVSDEQMITAASRDVDMMLTPNHRCLSKPVHSRGKFEFTPANGLKPNQVVPTAFDWYDGGFIVEEKIAELIGWYASDGHEIGKFMAGISQSISVNGDKVKRITTLLDSLGAEYSVYTSKRTWKGRPADMATFAIRGKFGAYLRGFTHNNKRIPLSVLQWDNQSLESLLAGFVGGDGHIRKSDGRFSISQKDEYTVDLFQAIGVRLGYTVVKGKQTDTQFTLFFTKRKSRSLRGTNGTNSILGSVSYTGTVWCPETESGTWVARRNGKVFITGNSFPTRLVEPIVKLGTSEHGVCELCLNPWTRNLIKEPVPDAVKIAFEAARTVSASNTGRTDGFTSRKPNYRRRILGEGWLPGCTCNQNVIPATVLDPFSGSGRAGVAAIRLGRNYIGIDQSWEYTEIASRLIGAELKGSDRLTIIQGDARHENDTTGTGPDERSGTDGYGHGV